MLPLDRGPHPEPSDDELIARLPLVRASGTPDSLVPSVDDAWRRADAALQASTRTARAASRPRSPSGASPAKQWMWRTRAALSLAVTGWLLVSALRHRSAPADMGGEQYATASGEQLTVTLHDGTRVTLAPRSSLRTMRYDDRERTVRLEGQAYFDVVSRPDAPFVVLSGPVQTRVLGTTFLVQHVPGRAAWRVAVTSGRVAVSAADARRAPVTIVAGNVGTIADSEAVVSVTDDAARYTDWTSGRLAFRDAPASDVVATLGQWYGYEFRLSDSTLAHERVTATLSTRSFPEAVATLKLLLGVDVRFDGTVVTLTTARGHGRRTAERLDPRSSVHASQPAREVGR